LIARFDARYFSNVTPRRHQLRQRRFSAYGTETLEIGGSKLKISARNVLEGTIKDVTKGATTSHVVVDAKGLTFTSSITNESVDDLGLKTGGKVKAIVKSSDVILAVE
jgi:molybdopterin-binding protein